ncbi:MAG TPA: CopD family protein, partial [Anaerolineae bacterium]
RGWVWWAGLVLAGGLALTSSLISHSAALSVDTLEAVVVDFAHILAAGLWAGGLVYLALALWQARRVPREARSWLNLSLIINFSGLAAIAVGLLITTGVYLAWKHVGSWTALVGTAYGLALLAKIAVALLAFAIAGANLFLVKPRLSAAYEEPNSEKAAQDMGRFGRLVRIEAVLALLVLVAAGILTDLQRGVDAPLLSDAPGRTVVTQTANDLEVQLAIEPALVGQNTFDVFITDASGQPVVDAAEVSLRYTFLGQSVGAASGEAEPLGNGRYRLQGSYISLVGPWQVEVSIRRPNAFDTFAPFRLEAGLGGNIRPLESGVQPLERFARFLTLAGGAATGAAMLLFALAWGFLATRAARSEWQLMPLLVISILVFWLGASQLVTFFEQEYTPSKFLTNPILPDVESIAVGERLYVENCVPCHGPEGRGNGPAAATLSPPPADFTSGHTATHTDGDLYYWIMEGIENTPMSSFGDRLTSEEGWHLVNYIRRLSNQSSQATTN